MNLLKLLLILRLISIEGMELSKIDQCSNCKHADEYIPLWIYPYGDPRCSVHHRNICPDDSCEDFELIGRLSR